MGKLHVDSNIIECMAHLLKYVPNNAEYHKLYNEIEESMSENNFNIAIINSLQFEHLQTTECVSIIRQIVLDIRPDTEMEDIFENIFIAVIDSIERKIVMPIYECFVVIHQLTQNYNSLNKVFTAYFDISHSRILRLWESDSNLINYVIVSMCYQRLVSLDVIISQLSRILAAAMTNHLDIVIHILQSFESIIENNNQINILRVKLLNNQEHTQTVFQSIQQVYESSVIALTSSQKEEYVSLLEDLFIRQCKIGSWIREIFIQHLNNIFATGDIFQLKAISSKFLIYICYLIKAEHITTIVHNTIIISESVSLLDLNVEQTIAWFICIFNFVNNKRDVATFQLQKKSLSLFVTVLLDYNCGSTFYQLLLYLPLDFVDNLFDITLTVFKIWSCELGEVSYNYDHSLRVLAKNIKSESRKLDNLLTIIYELSLQLWEQKRIQLDSSDSVLQSCIEFCSLIIDTMSWFSYNLKLFEHMETSNICLADSSVETKNFELSNDSMSGMMSSCPIYISDIRLIFLANLRALALLLPIVMHSQINSIDYKKLVSSLMTLLSSATSNPQESGNCIVDMIHWLITILVEDMPKDSNSELLSAFREIQSKIVIPAFLCEKANRILPFQVQILTNQGLIHSHHFIENLLKINSPLLCLQNGELVLRKSFIFEDFLKI
ncbi:hypothetical protein BJ742DRAFT_83367 [Cladochytrium replicatum]|nr:hypothetical protein BJ742DRAFT_83367 [Cladochytrium replicatum]